MQYYETIVSNFIETDLRSNIEHIRPYLGILLVGSIALGLGFIIHNATSQLVQNIYATAPTGVEGKLSLNNRGDVWYGDTISYKSSVFGAHLDVSNTYITTVCFQGVSMVFERSVLQGVPVYLYDQMKDSLSWDGKEATCSATLMYRKVNQNSVDVYVVASLSFDVKGRGQ